MRFSGCEKRACVASGPNDMPTPAPANARKPSTSACLSRFKAIERRPKEWDEKYNKFTRMFRDEVVSQSFLILDFL